MVLDDQYKPSNRVSRLKSGKERECRVKLDAKADYGGSSIEIVLMPLVACTRNMKTILLHLDPDLLGICVR